MWRHRDKLIAQDHVTSKQNTQNWKLFCLKVQDLMWAVPFWDLGLWPLALHPTHQRISSYPCLVCPFLRGQGLSSQGDMLTQSLWPLLHHNLDTPRLEILCIQSPQPASQTCLDLSLVYPPEHGSSLVCTPQVDLWAGMYASGQMGHLEVWDEIEGDKKEVAWMQPGYCHVLLGAGCFILACKF